LDGTGGILDGVFSTILNPMKIMKRNELIRKAGLASCFFLLPCVLPATYEVIEDFESYSTGPLAIETFDVQFWEASLAAELQIAEWPSGSGNKALWVSSTAAGTGLYGDTFVNFQPNQAIPAGGTGRLSFRAMITGTSLAWHITLADNYPVDVFGDNAVIVRVSPSDNGVVGARDGGSYLKTNPELSMTFGEFYEFVIEVDNAAATYQVYAKGPTDADFQLLTFGAGMTSTLNFRTTNYSGNDLSVVTIATNGGSDVNPHDNDAYLIDDLMIEADGSVATWAGFPLEDGRYVYTDDWLGTLDLDQWFDTGWAWSWRLMKWVYIPGEPSETGGGTWAYVPR